MGRGPAGQPSRAVKKIQQNQSESAPAVVVIVPVAKASANAASAPRVVEQKFERLAGSIALTIVLAALCQLFFRSFGDGGNFPQNIGNLRQEAFDNGIGASHASRPRSDWQRFQNQLRAS